MLVFPGKRWSLNEVIDLRYYYAQLNEDNICIGVSDLSSEVVRPDMIRIKTFDSTFMNKKYNNGLWEDIPISQSNMSQLDRIEEMVSTSYTDIQNAAIDSYTEELIKEEIL